MFNFCTRKLSIFWYFFLSPLMVIISLIMVDNNVWSVVLPHICIRSYLLLILIVHCLVSNIWISCNTSYILFSCNVKILSTVFKVLLVWLLNILIYSILFAIHFHLYLQLTCKGVYHVVFANAFNFLVSFFLNLIIFWF